MHSTKDVFELQSELIILYRASLRKEVKANRNPTALQTATIVEKRIALHKRLLRFRELQKTHMPGLDPKALSLSTPSDVPGRVTYIEDCKLYMPSELPVSERRRYCSDDLLKMEERLSEGDAFDALERLLHHLRTRSFINRFKVANITGQVRNTRARDTQSRIDDKVQEAASHYRRARQALLTLRGPGEWENRLRELQPSDVRALNERELTAQEKTERRRVRALAGQDNGEDDENSEVAVTQGYTVGEGQRRPSWIWFNGNMPESIDDSLTQTGMFILSKLTCSEKRVALQVEWAKADARAKRWEEEVILLNEEMRRVLQFCSWKASWWRSRPSGRLTDNNFLKEGLLAYAHEQAAREDEIASRWQAKWVAARAQAAPIIFGCPSTVSASTISAAAITLLNLDEEEDAAADDSDFEE